MIYCMEKECEIEAIIFYEAHFTWKPEEIVYISYCKLHGEIYTNKSWMVPVTKEEFVTSEIIDS